MNRVSITNLRQSAELDEVTTQFNLLVGFSAGDERSINTVAFAERFAERKVLFVPKETSDRQAASLRRKRKLQLAHFGDFEVIDWSAEDAASIIQSTSAYRQSLEHFSANQLPYSGKQSAVFCQTPDHSLEELLD